MTEMRAQKVRQPVYFAGTRFRLIKPVIVIFYKLVLKCFITDTNYYFELFKLLLRRRTPEVQNSRSGQAKGSVLNASTQICNGR